MYLVLSATYLWDFLSHSLFTRLIVIHSFEGISIGISYRAHYPFA